MKILTRLFTKNLTKIPLLWITFNWKLFKENGAKRFLYVQYSSLLKG